jgi:hypothetical protein
MIGSVVAGTIQAGFRYGPTVLLAGQSMSNYRDRVKGGQNPAFAMAMEGAQFAGNMFLPLPAQLALFGMPVTRAVTAGVINSVHAHNNFVRMAKTPFSHRFEHTDTTSRAQQLGLQSIGAAWGHASMGSEASMMARRYGR